MWNAHLLDFADGVAARCETLGQVNEVESKAGAHIRTVAELSQRSGHVTNSVMGVKQQGRAIDLHHTIGCAGETGTLP